MTLKVHPMSAKNIVKILPPSVLGERSPNPTVHIVTEDWRERRRGSGGGGEMGGRR